ncbi:pentapeptide repeat-containing protein [Alteromonas lipotrueae]|uniref:pentapeptide repeat-containing protein n=1 Tax=Alteromonas lipotrueae TaxID=2803814 RepID=UPI001C438221|nr:pentapeptide repeat-containing protein [Alteromonas lipotrueae]
MSMDDTQKQRIVDGVKDIAGKVASLNNTLVGFGIFSIFALTSPDDGLLGTNAKLTIPFAGVVSLKTFVFVGPVVLIALRVAIYVNFSHLRALTHTLIENSIELPHSIEIQRQLILRFYNYFVLYFFTPLVLGFFAWKAAAIDGWNLVAMAFIFATALHVFLVYIRIHDKYFGKRQKKTDIQVLIVTSAIACIVCFLTINNWSEYRRPFNLPRSDLSNLFLIQQNFSKADLTYAKLDDSNLGGASFDGASISYASFKNSHLNSSSFKQLNAFLANFSDSRLIGADLSSSYFSQVNFSGTDLSRVKFVGSDLSGSSFVNSNLQRADFKGASLFLANLRGADLRYALNLTCGILVQAQDTTDIKIDESLNCNLN